MGQTTETVKYGTDDAIRALLAEFRPGEHFLLTSHARPDGDAIGSTLALAAMLEQLGCTTEMVMADPVPFAYRKLPGVEKIAVREHAGAFKGTAILLECDGTERTGLKGLEGRRLLNIDHHTSGKCFGVVNWIDEHACAVAALVYRLGIAAEVKITPEIATCLYAAVLTDTGCFTYPGANAEAFVLAYELVRAGADAAQVAQDVYFSNRAAKLRLLGVALNHLHVHDTIAWSWVTSADLESCGAEDEDCEGAVNYLIGIDGIRTAAFFRELDGGNQYRLSVRSKGSVDVSLVAAEFGGGGHRNASGCSMDGPLEKAVERLVARLREAMHGSVTNS